MNRETIIQMAREAGLAEVTDTAESLPADYVEALAKLCALAVAKEREECARWGGQVVNLMRLAEAADKAVASMTVPAPEAGSESKIVIDVGPGGSGGGPAEAAPPATEQTAPAPAQDFDLTDEEIEAIAQKHMSTVGDHWCNEEAIRERHAEDFARAIIAALRAKEGK